VRRWRGAPWSRETLETLGSCAVGSALVLSSSGLALSAVRVRVRIRIRIRVRVRVRVRRAAARGSP
jgi:hypothetical protein